jgi:hypothetical protein
MRTYTVKHFIGKRSFSSCRYDYPNKPLFSPFFASLITGFYFTSAMINRLDHIENRIKEMDEKNNQIKQ